MIYFHPILEFRYQKWPIKYDVAIMLKHRTISEIGECMKTKYFALLKFGGSGYISDYLPKS